MSDNDSQSQSQSGDLKTTISNNKALGGVLSLLIAAALGAPLTIYAKDSDVQVLKEEVQELRRQVRDLKDGVLQAGRTGKDLKDRFDKIFPEFRKLTEEARIEKEIERRLGELQKKGKKE